ncbi:MAG: YqeG family HAD IIIA-type phosphatase [Clostridia bacterium]
MFKPSYYFKGIEDIDVNFFKKENIEGIIIDLDNTIIDVQRVISEEKMKWIGEVIESGVKICILSNSGNLDKVSSVAKIIGVPYLLNAMKPSKKGFTMALGILDLPKEKCAIIGDQVFTDVLGGNRYKMRSILVDPFDIFEPFWIKVKRPLENIIKYKMKYTDAREK